MMFKERQSFVVSHIPSWYYLPGKRAPVPKMSVGVFGYGGRGFQAVSAMLKAAGAGSASAPVGLDHGKQLSEPFLNVGLTGCTTGLRVHSDMLSKFRLINEALTTVTTGKRPLRSMYALVPKHVSLFPEVFVTLRAVERSLPCVQALVAEQLCL